MSKQPVRQTVGKIANLYANRSYVSRKKGDVPVVIYHTIDECLSLAGLSGVKE